MTKTKRKPRTTRVANPNRRKAKVKRRRLRAFYQRDFKGPRFELRLEWDGGPNREIEMRINDTVRRLSGHTEGSGCFIGPPYRRDYCVSFETRGEFLTARNELVELFNGETTNETETVLLRINDETKPKGATTHDATTTGKR